jgi:hypothetical protein
MGLDRSQVKTVNRSSRQLASVLAWIDYLTLRAGCARIQKLRRLVHGSEIL